MTKILAKGIDHVIEELSSGKHKIGSRFITGKIKPDKEFLKRAGVKKISIVQGSCTGS
jgi:hypothetical protein